MTKKPPLLICGMASLLALSACDKKTETPAPKTDIMTEAKTDTTADPYLWLEDVEGERALTWVRKHNDRSLGELEADSRYQPMLDEAKAILNSDERIQSASLRGGYAYNFWQDEANTRGLWRRMKAADYVAGVKTWDVILDLDALSEKENENWVYKGTDCLEPDYTRCMITLSRGGSDASVRREFNVATKTFVEDGYTLSEAKAGTAWVNKDFLLVGFPLKDGEVTDSGYPRVIRPWLRGEELTSFEPIFEGTKEDVGIWPFAGGTGENHFSGIIRSVTFFESEFYLLNEETMETTLLPLPLKSEYQGATNGKMIITLQQDWDFGGQNFATGSIVAFNPHDETATLIFEPKDRQAVDGVSTSDSSIYVNLLDNIVGKVLHITETADGWTSAQVDLPDAGVVSVSSVDGTTGDALIYFQNPTTPQTLYYLSGKGGAPKPLQTSPAFFNAAGMVTKQFEATSKDGTKVPYFVTAKQSTLDAGPAATIQYGYGGFQISILPNYSGTVGKMWLERGGVYVTANIRGGGEFGPQWHQAALKQNRQRAYDDFFAVSEDLIARGITTPKKLGILGGSNGGLLMGVSMVQRPDLYNAIGIGVPLLDMLRYDKLLAGASWVGEYGDPDLPEDRPHLEALSPYQNVKKDADYPRVYFFTSTKDDRVHPGHARKMAARMEEYGHDFLYYENIEGGHAASANQDQLAKRLALQYVYFSTQLMD